MSSMMRWFTDEDEMYWRYSKMDGGVQVEDEKGNFGKAMPLLALEELGLTPVSLNVAKVLSEFDALRISFNKMADLPANFKRVRGAMVALVERLESMEDAAAAEALPAAINAGVHQAAQADGGAVVTQAGRDA